MTIPATYLEVTSYTMLGTQLPLPPTTAHMPKHMKPYRLLSIYYLPGN